MEWKIGRGKDGCSRCGRVFGNGEPYYSTAKKEEDRLTRTDFCTGCFDPHALLPEAVFWKTRKLGEDRAKRSVDFEVLSELFFKMLRAKEGVFKEMAYLLALILIRKRILNLMEFTTQNGADCMAVRRKAGAPLVYVEVPLLEDGDLSGLRDQLALLLDADLDGDLDTEALWKRIHPSPSGETSPDGATPAFEPEQPDDSA